MEAQIIGGRITQARKKLNLSQSELAQRLFISPQAVGKWERGESMPDIFTFKRLAEILGVDLNYFADRSSSAANAEAPVESVDHEAADLPSGVQEKKLNWDMSRGNWADADFSGLINLHEKFSASNMQNCKFTSSDMSGLLLKSNNVNRCVFSHSDFSSSQIKRSNLANNLFQECKLRQAEFTESLLSSCDFSGADFSSVTFKSSGIEKSTLENAVWHRTSFIATRLTELVFDGRLEDCYFENCNFKKVTFRNATLINTFFKNNKLKGVQFIACQADRITYEFLKIGKADLSGITLLTK